MTTQSSTTLGNLYIVATPIGNLDDISLRAINTLKSVDAILAEDTRHSKMLLTHLGIQKPLIALHAHNEAEKSQPIIDQLLQGKSFALISDAGTPLISDPGYPLVHLAVKNDIKVIPIPGACALIAALSASGIACDSFSFLGFLPAKKMARLAMLNAYKHTPQTLIFYESTHRIVASLEDIIEALSEDTDMVLAKELTKTFETLKYDKARNILKWLTEDAVHQKGEFVLIIAPQPASTENNYDAMLLTLLKEVPLKQAVRIACQLTNIPKNMLYERALTLSS